MLDIIIYRIINSLLQILIIPFLPRGNFPIMRDFLEKQRVCAQHILTIVLTVYGYLSTALANLISIFKDKVNCYSRLTFSISFQSCLITY